MENFEPKQLPNVDFDQESNAIYISPWNKDNLPTINDVKQAISLRPPPVASTTLNVHNKRNTAVFPDIGVIVKTGRREALLREAINLRVLNLYYKDSMPIPKFCALVTVEGHEAYLFQELMPGQTLLDVWPGLSSEERNEICVQLHSNIKELRTLPFPDNKPFIGSINGGQICDWVFSHNLPCGPLQTLAEFHDRFAEVKHHGRLQIVSPARAFLKDDWNCDFCFTHGDVHRSNILVTQESQGNWKVSALLDFEHAGFMPSYWEHCKLQLWQREVSLEEYGNRIVAPVSEDINYGFHFHMRSVV